MSSGASGWAGSQPRRCAGRSAGAHRRGEEKGPTPIYEVNGFGANICVLRVQRLTDRSKSALEPQTLNKIEKCLSVIDKQQSTAAEPSRARLPSPHTRGEYLTRARVDRVWFSGKHPPIIPVAFCRRFYAGLSEEEEEEEFNRLPWLGQSGRAAAGCACTAAALRC